LWVNCGFYKPRARQENEMAASLHLNLPPSVLLGPPSSLAHNNGIAIAAPKMVVLNAGRFAGSGVGVVPKYPTL
jgi:hypothetical protein